MTTSCTDRDHPYYEKIKTMTSSEQIMGFLIAEKPNRMKYVSLGEALDFISAGALNYVYWNLSTKGLIDFIKKWIERQEPRVRFEYIPDPQIKGVYSSREKSREYFYVWNRFQHEFGDAELPHIHYDKCPRDDKHKGILITRGLTTRCAHADKKGPFRANFIRSAGLYLDRYAGMQKEEFHEQEPRLDDEIPDYAWPEDQDKPSPAYVKEYKKNLELIRKFESEEPTEIITDVCYAIISEDKKKYLPLETVLDRLSLKGDEGETTFPFSGVSLAEYIKTWWNQPGEKKFIEKIIN